MSRNASIKLRDWQTDKPARNRKTRNLRVVRGATVEEKTGPAFHFRLPEQAYPVLGVMLVLSIIAGSCMWLAKHYAASFAVQHVTIQGEFHNKQAHEIEVALTPYMQGDFFTVDLKGARESVMALPWVRYAGLRRQWPNQVLVAIEEQVPVARWDENTLLNEAGEIFYHDYVADNIALPVLSGPNNHAAKVLFKFEQLRALLEPAGIVATGLTLSLRDTWRLSTEDGISIELGSENIEARLQRLVDVWPAALQARRERIAAIDLRYSNGFAVAWLAENSNPGITEKKRDV